MKNIEFAVPAAMPHTGPGVSPLSAAVPDAGGFGLPVARCAAGAAWMTGPRLVSRKAAERVRLQAQATVTKPMTTNIRKHVYMTRVNADGEGASGPSPAREPA